MAKIFALMLVVLPSFASAAALNTAHSHVVALPMNEYMEDCGTKRAFGLLPGATALLQQDNVPGAGINKFEPFEKVLKDGFLEQGCVKDYMYYRGDKFGDNKHDYKLGPVGNVSIVHYEAFVAREDRHKMTQKVCFEFCRTVPNMGFFGIVNGRGCYCTPYFKPMESGSEICDSVCEGDNTLMCGGKSKSSIFAMHFCASTADDLSEKSGAASSLKSLIDFKSGDAKQVADYLQGAGEKIQKTFGAVGDSGATSQGQAAKVFAGKMLNKAEEAKKVSTKIGKLGDAGAALKDFNKPETVTKAERIMEETDETVAKGEAVTDELDELISLGVGEAAVEHKINSSKQYYPVMYFVDKEFDSVPSTCAGDMVGEPIVGTEDTCASTCDANIHSCVGYQFFSNGAAGICVLLSRFTSAFYYTGCGPSKKSALVQKHSSFLQRGSSGKTAAMFQMMGKKEKCPDGTDITSPAECLEAYNIVKAGSPSPFKYPALGKHTPRIWNPAFPSLEPLYVGAWPGLPNHCSMQFEATPKDTWVEDHKDQTPHFSTNAATDNARFNAGEYRMLCKIVEKEEPLEPKCVAKLSKFEGTTLKPDGSGKCKQCLKDLTKADRCYK